MLGADQFPVVDEARNLPVHFFRSPRHEGPGCQSARRRPIGDHNIIMVFRIQIHDYEMNGCAAFYSNGAGFEAVLPCNHQNSFNTGALGR